MKPDHQFVDMIKSQDIRTSKTVQHLSLFFPSKDHKLPTIGDVVQVYGGAHSRSIIFTDKKSEANEVLLHGNLKVEAQVLHGDIPQKQREVTFESFRNGKLKCLIATNVAARGLDIPEVDLIVQLSPPEEIEAYIHRSGRTGRAGKSGVCVTFYTKREEQTLRRIEQNAKIRFTKVGAPQPSDIIKATARDVAVSFDNVSNEVLPLFKETISDILEKYTADEALARAVAIISGCDKLVRQRSLLCSAEGYITYIIKIDYEARTNGYFWNFLRNHYRPELVDSVKGLKMLADRKGCALDISDKLKDEFESKFEELNKEHAQISIATSLPDLEPE